MSIAPAPPRPKLSFAAMRHPQFRWFFWTYVIAMMADNIEHVISYWIMFQKFHSPALGGFAVLSHWLPFLFFSLPMGGVADRVDPRRLIQIGMVLFILVSLGWGLFFLTNSLTMSAAMALLVVHGCAGVFWQGPSQMILHEIVPTEDLQSGVRLNATARYLGVLVGPAVGGAMLIVLGAKAGILVNTLFYLPLVFWLQRAPFRKGRAYVVAASERAVKGIGDLLRAVGEVATQPALLTMILLVGLASGLVGNSYQAQMPNFAHDLGHGDPGVLYSVLLAADAAGAIVAAFALETVASLPVRPGVALGLALGWCGGLVAFALAHSYPLAIACLFVAGFCELSFSSIAQTVVQLRAPAGIRGRILGLFNMAALGCRSFAGISVGIVGSLVGVHYSLALAAGGLAVVVAALLVRERRAA